MRELTLGQRATRPLINWLVETFFPSGLFFYGRGPLVVFNKVAEERETSGGYMAAMYLMRIAYEANADELEVIARDVTINNENIGDWEIIVRRVYQGDEGNCG